MNLDDFDTEELIKMSSNFNYYSVILKNNILFGELKLENIQKELIKRGLEKKDDVYFVKIEQLPLLEPNNIIHKDISVEDISLPIQKNKKPSKIEKTKPKTQLNKSPIKLSFNHKYFTLYQIEGNSLTDLKINSEDLILIKNIPAKIKNKLKKLKTKFISDVNNTQILNEWVLTLMDFNSKLIVFNLNNKMFVKELNILENRVYLMSKNNHFFNYNLSINSNFEILGVVTNIIRNLD